jgi:hypothetical protein
MMPMNGGSSPSRSAKSKLEQVVVGRRRLPWKTLLHGVEKVGKSTFGQNAPAPIFLASEEGTANLDVVRYPDPENWGDFLFALRDLLNTKHEYQTCVIDTVDWFEGLLHDHVCKANNWKTIDEPDFGKGTTAAIDEWRVAMRLLDDIRLKRGMNILVLAHSWVKTFKNPLGVDFDRYELKLRPKTSALWKEWAEDILFANYDTMVVKDKGTRGAKTRGSLDEEPRYLYTVRRAPYDAGNRHSLPHRLDLSYAAYEAGLSAFYSLTPEDVGKKIEEMLSSIVLVDSEPRRAFVAQVRGYLEKNPAVRGNLAKMLDVQNRVNSKLVAFEDEMTGTTMGPGPSRPIETKPATPENAETT